MTPDEAARTLAAYRARHRIDPEYTRSAPTNWCRGCGVGIHPIRGGFRHDAREVHDLVRLAPPRLVTH